MSSTLDRVREVAARELKVPMASLSAATEASDVAGWTSANHLVLMMALEEEFEMNFELDEVVELTGIARIVDVIDAKMTSR